MRHHLRTDFWSTAHALLFAVTVNYQRLSESSQGRGKVAEVETVCAATADLDPSANTRRIFIQMLTGPLAQLLCWSWRGSDLKLWSAEAGAICGIARLRELLDEREKDSHNRESNC
ncbi:hypothetical protein R3I94_005000 [Phoxinus phoxinus]